VFDSRQRLKFLAQTSSGTHPGLVSSEYWGIFLREIKRPERVAEHSPPSSAEVKNVELYLHSPIRVNGVVLI
jgi:hypothetical protein